MFSGKKETDEKDDRLENFPGETNKTLAVLEALPIRVNLEKIFRLPNDTSQHLVIALQHSKLYTNKVKDVDELSEFQI